jgi:hypothetical protein
MDNTEAPKVALRPIGSLFSDAWKLYRERWSVLVEIVLLPTLVVILGIVLIALDLGTLIHVLASLAVFAGWVTFMYSVLPLIYSIHHETGVDASYKATVGWFWPYVWAMILTILAVMGGFIMLAIPGIWLGTALAFVVYVFVTEQRRGIDALRQSKDYVKGYWWAVLGRTLLLALIYIVMIVVIQLPLALVGGRILSSLASAVLVLFFIPFAMIYNYLIFENLRERKPELLEAHTKEGTGFITASAIVGIVAPVLLVVLAVTVASAGAFYMMRHANVRYGPCPALCDPATVSQ